MEKISFGRAFITGMHIYEAGAEPTLYRALHCAFQARAAINYALDHGVTEKEIQECFDRADREEILSEAAHD